MSRACYAAFHAAQAVLLTEGQRGETHRGPITLFGLLLVKTGKFDKQWGKLLANLKDDRETLEDLLASTAPEYLKSIREARADYRAVYFSLT